MQELLKARDFLLESGIVNPQVGVVLGTGLNKLLDRVEIVRDIPYANIPGFPEATVEYHKGHLVYGTINGVNTLIMQGRYHAYEGYSMEQIVFPVRVMKLLGITKLFLSNAAGGITLNFKKGDLVLIEDHINLQSGNPLTGKNQEQLGPRFPDMSEPYDPALRALLISKAADMDIHLKKGVYVAVNGPNLETKAEYRYLKIIGADMVGMSTVPEVIAANHLGLACAAISVITDECDPNHLSPVNISEIIAVAGRADEKLSRLFYDSISSL